MGPAVYQSDVLSTYMVLMVLLTVWIVTTCHLSHNSVFIVSPSAWILLHNRPLWYISLMPCNERRMMLIAQYYCKRFTNQLVKLHIRTWTTSYLTEVLYSPCSHKWSQAATKAGTRSSIKQRRLRDPGIHILCLCLHWRTCVVTSCVATR